MHDIKSTFIIIAGMIWFSAVLLVVLAPENLAEYTVIDTAFHKTDHRLIGRAAYNFNNASEIAKFPRKIDGWHGIDFRYPERVYEVLEADIVLSRAYSKEGNVIWMDVINSDKRKSFHDPRVCYGGAWNIVNESVAEIDVNPTAITFDRIYVNRLDLENKNNQAMLVVFYWFMFRGGEGVTMIRLSSPAHENSNTYASMQNFVKSLMNVMYEEVKKPRSVGEAWVDEYGLAGNFGIAVLLLPPLALIAWVNVKNLAKKSSHSDKSKTGEE
jgi:hypothetical protein